MRECMRIGLLIISIATVSSVVATVSGLLIGELVAPGVFFTIGGSFISTETITKPIAYFYALKVFVWFFIFSLVSAYAAIYFNKNT